MIETRTDCVRCDACVSCGADVPYRAVLCDKCRQEIPPSERVYLDVGKFAHLCEDCLLDAAEWVRAEELEGST